VDRKAEMRSSRQRDRDRERKRDSDRERKRDSDRERKRDSDRERQREGGPEGSNALLAKGRVREPPAPGQGFGVKGLGFRVQGLGFRAVWESPPHLPHPPPINLPSVPPSHTVG